MLLGGGGDDLLFPLFSASQRFAAVLGTDDHLTKKLEGSSNVVVGESEVTIPAVKTSLVGDTFSVPLNEVAFEAQLATFDHYIIAQIVLSKDDKPWKLANLKAKLSIIWNLQSLKLISMGQGFFPVLSYSSSNKRRVWSKYSLSLKLRTLKLWELTWNFNLDLQNSTNVQVCVRFYLNWVYWYP